MSYYLHTVADRPQSLYMLDGALADSSGRSRTPTGSGTLVYGASPLVYDGNSAYRSAAGTSFNYPFPYMAPTHERHAFTIEAWFFPIATSFNIMTHSGDTDGLAYINGEVNFSIKLSSGYIRVKYRPSTPQAMHVVGVYSGISLTLWVNGENVAEYQLTEAEQALSISLTSNDGKLYSGGAAGILQAVATYYITLTPTQIKNHYNAGRMSVPNDIVKGMYGGVEEIIDHSTANLFLSTKLSTREQFLSATYTCAVGDVVSSLNDDTGAYLAGTWETSLGLEAGDTSINGIVLYWTGEGTYLLETSLDGTTWATPTNGQRLAAVTNGYDPTGKQLFIRLTFTAGTYGEVSEIGIVGFKTMTVTSGQRPITLPVAATLHPRNDVLEYDKASGVDLANSTLTIGATADADAAFALGFWYYANSGTVTTNTSPTTFYENGVARAERTLLGEWVYTVRVFSSKTNAITITGDAIIMAPVVYPATLTAAKVLAMFQSYTGIPVLAIAGPNFITINTPLAEIYDHTWSITSAG